MDDELYQEMENELCRNLWAIAENIGIDPDSFDDDACQMACMIKISEAIRDSCAK